MRGITKRFPGTLALDDVTFEVAAGTIHGLVGENGAGKSTLLKLLAGEYRPTSGTIELDGEAVDIANPRAARDLGIGIVYQELSLLPNLSVAHNISLGGEPTNGLRIDERALAATARDVLARIGAGVVHPARKVSDLPLAERQLVEIAKVLTLRRPRVLIFDEPTAALVQADVHRLFAVMRSLRDAGVAIVFVSHRYREILEICDRATVLRNGRVVAALDRGEATLARLVEHTLGEKNVGAYARERDGRAYGEPLLEARGLSVGVKLRDIDLVVRRGEIVGVCGLLGAGQNELARALAGDARDVTGSVVVRGADSPPRSPRGAFDRGLGLVTEKRQEEGLFPNLTVRGNIGVASLSSLVWSKLVRVISPRRERRLTRAAGDRVGIASSAYRRSVRVLSGGNQQKSILARWLMAQASVLVAIEPTRGVDVGAKVEIYRQLEQLAERGAAVLAVSTDIPEIMTLSDRVVVLYKGRVAAELDPRTAGEHDVLLAMQGGGFPEPPPPEPEGAVRWR
jgi:ABC-type sugar transport system ATPase subunit